MPIPATASSQRACRGALRYRSPQNRRDAEHRPLACAPSGDVLRCFVIIVLRSLWTGVQTRWAHRLKVYVPAASLLGGALSQQLRDVEIHKIGVMKNNRFDRALDLVTLVAVRGDDVQHFAGNSVLVRERDDAEWIWQLLPELS